MLAGRPCGGTTNATPNVLFGSYFTLDGVHPSAAAHQVLADLVIDGVNQTYGTTIPALGP
jgi:lysophospholipase L1-like esterase